MFLLLLGCRLRRALLILDCTATKQFIRRGAVLYFELTSSKAILQAEACGERGTANACVWYVAKSFNSTIRRRLATLRVCAGSARSIKSPASFPEHCQNTLSQTAYQGLTKQGRATGAESPPDQRRRTTSDAGLLRSEIRKVCNRGTSRCRVVHNVKIMAQSGAVTVKGPVRSTRRKEGNCPRQGRGSRRRQR